jgi:hypothetical protein
MISAVIEKVKSRQARLKTEVVGIETSILSTIEPAANRKETQTNSVRGSMCAVTNHIAKAGGESVFSGQLADELAEARLQSCLLSDCPTLALALERVKAQLEILSCPIPLKPS